MSVLRNYECDRAYKVDWLCAILTRFGNNLEDSLLSHIREARSILANLTLLQLFAFKHKPQTFLRVCLRFCVYCFTVDAYVVVWAQFGRSIFVCMYVCMYVYEDSNFGGFRIPHVYANAQKWFDIWPRKHASFIVLACFPFYVGLYCEICSLKLSLLREDFLLYQGKIIIICNWKLSESL